jgi:hypothetical protein
MGFPQRIFARRSNTQVGPPTAELGAVMNAPCSAISPATLEAIRSQAGDAASPREVARALIRVLRGARIDLRDVPLEEVKAALFDGLRAADLA